MNKTSPGTWQKMGKQNIAMTEKLLREQELRCVAACSRFLKHSPSTGTVWIQQNKDKSINALIVYSNKIVLPVFCGNSEISEPLFLNGFLGTIPVHSMQGLHNDVIFLENYLSKCGLEAIDKIDYDYMYIDVSPKSENFFAGPTELILRNAQYNDFEEIAALQAGYEQEEVLPRGAVFNPIASRLNTEKIFAKEQLLVAELGGKLVGKINTSAHSFTRIQIGGVYVIPGFRNMGIARRMTAEFVRMLIDQGRGVSLFVKKSNPAASSVYHNIGFNYLEDYRICYY